ncbi:holo-ACP synthase [Flavitalea flava]
MEEKIKEIISVFIKIPPQQIDGDTVIDRSALQSSILLHRMYARLAESGVTVENYTLIRNFGDLIRGNPGNGQMQNSTVINSQPAYPLTGSGIGIDIEQLSAMPETNDFRKEEFYKMNFTSAEIAYCILQPDPYASLTGLFASKEAIVKANGQYRNRAFNSIEIDHLPDGRPVHPGFRLSISHAGGLAVAVAIRTEATGQEDRNHSSPVQQILPGDRSSSPVLWLTLIALAFSVFSFLFILYHWH